MRECECRFRGPSGESTNKKVVRQASRAVKKRMVRHAVRAVDERVIRHIRAVNERVSGRAVNERVVKPRTMPCNFYRVKAPKTRQAPAKSKGRRRLRSLLRCESTCHTHVPYASYTGVRTSCPQGDSNPAPLTFKFVQEAKGQQVQPLDWRTKSAKTTRHMYILHFICKTGALA